MGVPKCVGARVIFVPAVTLELVPAEDAFSCKGCYYFVDGVQKCDNFLMCGVSSIFKEVANG
jgi:hypothetical protein